MQFPNAIILHGKLSHGASSEDPQPRILMDRINIPLLYCSTAGRTVAKNPHTCTLRIYIYACTLSSAHENPRMHPNAPSFQPGSKQPYH